MPTLTTSTQFSIRSPGKCNSHKTKNKQTNQKDTNWKKKVKLFIDNIDYRKS